MSDAQNCPVCGGIVQDVTERQAMPVGRWSTEVDVSFSRCGSCGEEFVTPEQMRANQLAAAARVRAERGIIAPDRIRSIRARYGLTQADLERMLELGEKTIVRWERGTVLPGAAANTLLLLLESQSDIVMHLARQAGVSVRPVAMLRYTELNLSPRPDVRERPWMGRNSTMVAPAQGGATGYEAWENVA
ncbi:MAG: type II toxin-antitoxin system MqsA family antitoxin [Candidatus Eisenbacteria bacterium]|nr:type II toxin-antitoxin system MqsA family antitoxin [Candidatus Eisenbacteria bacterium]